MPLLLLILMWTTTLTGVAFTGPLLYRILTGKTTKNDHDLSYLTSVLKRTLLLLGVTVSLTIALLWMIT